VATVVSVSVCDGSSVEMFNMEVDYIVSIYVTLSSDVLNVVRKMRAKE
jgi:hypothetical protein